MEVSREQAFAQVDRYGVAAAANGDPPELDP